MPGLLTHEGDFIDVDHMFFMLSPYLAVHVGSSFTQCLHSSRMFSKTCFLARLLALRMTSLLFSPKNVFRKSLLQLFREWPLRSRHNNFTSSMNSALVRAMWHKLLASATAARAVSSSSSVKKSVTMFLLRMLERGSTNTSEVFSIHLVHHCHSEDSCAESVSFAHQL